MFRLAVIGILSLASAILIFNCLGVVIYFLGVKSSADMIVSIVVVVLLLRCKYSIAQNPEVLIIGGRRIDAATLYGSAIGFGVSFLSLLVAFMLMNLLHYHQVYWESVGKVLPYIFIVSVVVAGIAVLARERRIGLLLVGSSGLAFILAAAVVWAMMR